MTNIDSIIKYLDDYLVETGQKELNAVDANKLLAKANLLRDSKSRLGKPLRELLRVGQLPHAYQVNGRFWYIPHSVNSKKAIHIVNTSPPKTQKKKTIPTKIDLAKLKEKISEARNKYKPNNVKCLFIAEAPPDNVERFFYYEDVRKADYLFLGLTEVLYPDLKEDYLKKKRPIEMKTKILNKFQDNGYYLIDLLDIPKDYFDGDWNDAASLLVTKIKSDFGEQVLIIITKVNVFDVLYLKLLSKGFINVSKERLPFPSTGGQKEFREGFKRALKKLNLI